MKMNGTCNDKRMIRLLMILFLPLMLLTSGCSVYNSVFNSSSEKAATNSDRTLWHSREQNVRIVKQDIAKSGAGAQNDHPIMLDPGQIRHALASLEVRFTRDGKLVPVFTEAELDVLGSKLSEGLAQAGPNEDITFVIIGQRRAVYGIAKQRKVTTGRVFYKDGKLNVIFGKMVADIGEHADFRFDPLSPGSRTKPVSHEWILEDEPDVQFYAGGDMIRSDWVVMDLASMVAHEALGTKPVVTARSSSEMSAGSPQRVSTPQETGQGQGPAYQASTVTQISQPGKVNRSIEERLQILNNLKNKQLITDEEYKTKRASILNDL